jgi:hypothetical protein
MIQKTYDVESFDDVIHQSLNRSIQLRQHHPLYKTQQRTRQKYLVFVNIMALKDLELVEVYKNNYDKTTILDTKRCIQKSSQ